LTELPGVEIFRAMRNSFQCPGKPARMQHSRRMGGVLVSFDGCAAAAGSDRAAAPSPPNQDTAGGRASAKSLTGVKVPKSLFG